MLPLRGKKQTSSTTLNANDNLRAERVPFDTVCFHCQQAAEKLLKAFLAAQGHAAATGANCALPLTLSRPQ